MSSLGTTRRGLQVYGPAHDSYKNLERVRLLGAKPSELGHLAQQAHPNYRAVDHEEASIMHHQRQNFHAARAHQAASESMAKSGVIGQTKSGKPIHHSAHKTYAGVQTLAQTGASVSNHAKAARSAHPGYSKQDHADASYAHHQQSAKEGGAGGEGLGSMNASHAHAAAFKQMRKSFAKSDLGNTSSGMTIAPAFSSPLQWVYAGMDPKTGIDDAALAIQAVTPDWSQQDHADHGAAYHELALHFARATPPDDRGPVCAAAAFMHLAACGVNPAADPTILKSFLVPDAKTKPVDQGPRTAQKFPSMSADDHLKQARLHLDKGSTKRALQHIQAAHFVGKQKVVKGGRKPLGAAFSHARAVVDSGTGGEKKKKEIANRYLKRKGHSAVGKSFLGENISLLKATRYQGMNGGDIDNLHRSYSEAEQRSRAADKSGSYSDHIVAAGSHMYAAKLHKEYAPEARDRILHHIKSSRYHTKAAGAPQTDRGYMDNKRYHDAKRSKRGEHIVVKKSLAVTLAKAFGLP